jgi:integrase
MKTPRAAARGVGATPDDVDPGRGTALPGLAAEASASAAAVAAVSELATDWLEARERNPAIRSRTTELNRSQLKRYLVPFFGELLPSQIPPGKVKQYRQQIHTENAQIRAAQEAGKPLRDPRTRQLLRTLANESINKTLRTLAVILDEAEDEGWVTRNVARGPRTREPLERRPSRGALDVDELETLLDAAAELDAQRHKPATLEKAAEVRALRDEAGMEWKRIAACIKVAPATAVYLYGCHDVPPEPSNGVRRSVIATLALAGPRVTELCQLDNQDLDLVKARLHIRDAKTEAGVRTVDMHPRLLHELSSYRALPKPVDMEAPAFPSRTGSRRNKDNVGLRIVQPVLARANALRSQRGQPAIRVHVTPHTFRRTYITYMLAAGYDLPYVQDQVGHRDPTTTLRIYAQLIRRPDRDQLRAEMRALLLDESSTEERAATPTIPEKRQNYRTEASVTRLRRAEKAAKGRALQR